MPDIIGNENFRFGDENISLSKIWQKLSRNNQYRKKRELKAALKLSNQHPGHSSVKSLSACSVLD